MPVADLVNSLRFSTIPTKPKCLEFRTTLRNLRTCPKRVITINPRVTNALLPIYAPICAAESKRPERLKRRLMTARLQTAQVSTNHRLEIACERA